MSTVHEKHVCRDCGAEITLPYAKPDDSLEGYWEKAYWRVVPKLAEMAVGAEPPLIDGCRIYHRGDGFDVCRVHYRHWKTGSQMCPGRQMTRRLGTPALRYHGGSDG